MVRDFASRRNGDSVSFEFCVTVDFRSIYLPGTVQNGWGQAHTTIRTHAYRIDREICEYREWRVTERTSSPRCLAKRSQRNLFTSFRDFHEQWQAKFFRDNSAFAIRRLAMRKREAKES